MCLDKVSFVLEIVVIHVVLITVDFSQFFTHNHAELTTSV